jgi:hypothetical protein
MEGEMAEKVIARLVPDRDNNVMVMAANNLSRALVKTTRVGRNSERLGKLLKKPTLLKLLDSGFSVRAVLHKSRLE